MSADSRNAATAPALRERQRVLRLLDAEPDLARGVDPHEAEQAARGTIATLVTLEPGAWDPAALRSDEEVCGPFGALVLGGLLSRDIVLADRVTTQLLGTGDLIPLSGWDDGGPPVDCAWCAAAETHLAVLDGRFLAAAQRWPWLTARVVERALRWADRAATLQAIGQLGRVDLRLIALFWHLADRWGRVGPEGIVVPLRLTHEALGRLVGAQRPTVTLALRDLREAGALHRRGAAWILTNESRELLDRAPRPQLPVEDGVAIVTSELRESRRLTADDVRAAHGRAASAIEQAQAGRDESLLKRAEALRTRRERRLRKLPPTG